LIPIKLVSAIEKKAEMNSRQNKIVI